jgi:hypothetical protein
MLKNYKLLAFFARIQKNTLCEELILILSIQPDILNSKPALKQNYLFCFSF